MNLRCLEPGTLHLITGGMKGKKTPKFLYYFDQLQYTDKPNQLFKPKCDQRSELHDQFNFPSHYIVSRTGMGLPSTEIDDTKPQEIWEKLDYNAAIIGIEEVTLFDQREELAQIILTLMKEGKCVVASGLDKDFRGEPFDPMPLLMTYATTIDKNYGICDIPECNNLGEYSQRIIDGKPAPYDSPIKLVGASEAYEIRCLKHHEVPGKP